MKEENLFLNYLEIKIFTMKTIILLLSVALLNFGFSIKGDDKFSIIKVNGKVVNAKSKKKLNAGDSLNPKDKLVFEDMNASCFIYSKSSGRYMLKAGDKLEVDVENALKPVGLRSSITTRGASNVNDTLPVSDLYYFFGKNKFVFLNDVTTLKIDTGIFNKGIDRVMVAKYTDEKGVIHNVEIGKATPKLTLNLQKIFKEKDAKGNIKVQKFELVDYNKMTKDIKHCAFVNPVLVDNAELTESLNYLVNALDGVNEKSLFYDEIYAFVYNEYGEFNPDDLKLFISKNNIIK
jgi:hypothetical protein